MAATVWRGRLAFGMVSIPVRLTKAARRERIRFHRVYRPSAGRSEPPPEPEDEEQPGDAAVPARPPWTPPQRGEEQRSPGAAEFSPPPALARVRHSKIAENTGRPIAPAEILKGFEVEKDRYVTFQPQEVAALRPRTSTELEIAEFVRLEEIDPLFFETSYYAAADSGGEKPYALLYRALAETEYAAVGSLAMHGREHAAVIRAGKRGLILHTLYFNNEVRASEEYAADAALVSARELDLAKLLVKALAAPFDASKLKDAFEERLRQLIDARAETALEAYSREAAAKPAPVVDIMEALRKSLENAKRPPARETAGADAVRTRHRHPKPGRKAR